MKRSGKPESQIQHEIKRLHIAEGEVLVIRLINGESIPATLDDGSLRTMIWIMLHECEIPEAESSNVSTQPGFWRTTACLPPNGSRSKYNPHRNRPHCSLRGCAPGPAHRLSMKWTV
jgi:hypothetical protein